MVLYFNGETSQNSSEQVYQQVTQNYNMIIEMSNIHVFYNIMSNWDLIQNMTMRNLKLAHIINDYKKVVDPNYFLYGFLPRMQLG
jgi:hypothetical protein